MSSLPSAESAKAMLAVGQTVLQTQPFSRFLGARLSAFDGKDVDLTIPLRPEFLQQHGFAHGWLPDEAADRQEVNVPAVLRKAVSRWYSSN